MRHESLNGTGQQNAGWDNLKDTPFREVKHGNEETPLEDSMHYWPPEMLANYGVVPPSGQQYKASQPYDNTKPVIDIHETARNYEDVPDAKSRAKVLNLLKWRSMKTHMDDSDPSFRRELDDIITNNTPEPLSEEAEEEVLYDIRDGVYGTKDEKFLLEQIAPPSLQYGNKAVLDSLRDLHERRFLANFTAVGFNGYNNLGEYSVREFMNKYPTPMDFVGDLQQFVGDITRRNGEQKGAEYKEAAESFMNKVYGKRYKYYKQFEELKAEAEELPDTYETMGEKLPKGVGLATVARGTLRAIRDYVAQNGAGLNGTEFTQRLCSETLKYRHEQANESQDSVYINNEQRIYGVFDGAGGVAGGREASRLASRVTGSLAKQYSLGDARQLANVLTMAGAKIVNATHNGREVGITTGSLAQFVDGDDGIRRVAFASVGDSRIYVVHADGSAELLTQDEGYENKIENYLGYSNVREYDDAGIMRYDRGSGRQENVTQYGERNLVRGDRVVICSDGITGDKGTDLMSPEEVGYYVAGAKTAQAAAESLLGYARKLDDRTALVLDAYPAGSSVVDGFLKRFFKK